MRELDARFAPVFEHVTPANQQELAQVAELARPKIRNGEQLEPVPAERSHDGKLVLTDGHHRFAAAMAERAKIRMVDSSATEPTPHADWSQVKEIDSFTGNDMVN
ncbi:hypothetical protein J8I87_25175 [Paraburkholderia sp. LEh10]|uniref:ParB/Srx family N-terminal domain-containing protein n=1 Tax=Paraburkholderia sp. LEh10 TaxID=2821353 RepID=UPI001AE2E194|nr:ParB/Srx family N-terminal domain-containing protein [Paraburkholderia sp. LEh10]MBP0592959.1 hypothetical protein [Paraburkholderia sp. LEh10]